MHAEFDALGMLRPDEEPRATQYIPQMQAMIGRLLEADKAYVADSGDVLCRVRACDSYGCLSGRRLDEQRAGARVQVDESKEKVEDFALWKMADEPARKAGLVWPSPWGAGRPGWHLECSAMALELLGEDFDLHGGGLDLKFPHHENEIAQAEGAGHSFARHWMHTAPLRLRGAKMSKSLGNVSSIAEALEQHPPQVVRLALLSAHYRAPLEYDQASFGQAAKALRRLWEPLSGAVGAGGAAGGTGSDPALEGRLQDVFMDAMEDDLNIPVAVAGLHSELQGASLGPGTAKLLAQILGVLGIHPQAGAKAAAAEKLDDGEAAALVARRLEHKNAEEWDSADALRKRLEGAGLEVRDERQGTSWRRPGGAWQKVEG